MVNKAYLSKDFGKELVQRLFDQDYSLSVLIEVISKLNPELTEVTQLKNVVLDLEELRDFAEMKNNNAITILKNAIRKIKETIIEFDDGRIWEPVSFFDRAYIDSDDNTVNIDINDRFLPYLTNLKEFLVLSRNAIKANLRSLRFYTFLRSIHRDTPRNVCVELIQAQMGVSYKKYSEFKRNFLNPVQKDLAQAGISLEIIGRKGTRNKVKYLDFYISEAQEKAMQNVVSSQWEIDPKHSAKEYAKAKEENNEVQEIYDYYMKVFNRDPRYTLTRPRKTAIMARLKEGFTAEECKGHIDFISKSPYHNGQNENKTLYIDLVDIIFNKTKFDKRIEEVNKLKNKKQGGKKQMTEEEFKKLIAEEDAKIDQMIKEGVTCL